METYEAFFHVSPLPAVIWRLRNGEIVLVNANKAATRLFDWDTLAGKATSAMAETIFSRTPYLAEDLRRCHETREAVSMYVCGGKGFHCAKEGDLLRLDPGPGGHVFMQVVPREEDKNRHCFDKLQENRRFLQGFFDHAEAGIAVWDLDYRYVLINKSECARLGVTREKAQGKKFSDIFSAQRAALYCRRDKKALQQGVVFEEPSLLAEDNRHFQVNIFYLCDADGEAYGIGCVSRDITDKKEVEEVSLANKHEFDLVLKNVPVTICYIDSSFQCRFVNDAYAAWYGRRLDEIEGRDIREFLGREKFGQLRERVMAAFRGETVCFENTLVDADGWERVLSTYYIPHVGPEKEMLGVVAMGVDITERKRAEQELSGREKLLRDVLDAIQGGVSVLDRDLRIVRVNKFIENTYGKAEELIGKACYEIFFQRKTFCNACIGSKVLQEGKPQSMEQSYATADGQKGWLEHFAFPLRNDQGDIIGIVAYFSDITEKKRLMAEAVRAGQLACIGELAASVAHEVNNPIMGMINYAQVLLDRNDLRGDGPDLLARIIKEGDRIKHIVHNLLFFARDLKQEYAPIRIIDSLWGALDLTRSQLEREDITLALSIPNTLPLVVGGERELRQVFLNIISNARYALNRRFVARPAEKYLRIFAEAVKREEKAFVRIFFRDNGIGIPADVRSRIFDPFFSTKPEGEGTGLGLSISYDIVREQGGNLYAESEVGSHTQIIVELPAAFSS